jgi:hypothetical protein
MAPGLALSRSIGDAIGKKLGVCADPEFLRHPISSRDKVAIFFSDGVCEYMTNEEVLALVMKHSPDPHKAAAAVVEEACVHLPVEEAPAPWSLSPSGVSRGCTPPPTAVLEQVSSPMRAWGARLGCTTCTRQSTRRYSTRALGFPDSPEGCRFAEEAHLVCEVADIRACPPAFALREA